MNYFCKVRNFDSHKFTFRCLFINIDPETAEQDPDQEPLKTLKSYRKFAKTGESPVMGIHVGLRKKGNIRLGDSVYVAA